MIDKFLNQTSFTSTEDFAENYKVNVPYAMQLVKKVTVDFDISYPIKRYSCSSCKER